MTEGDWGVCNCEDSSLFSPTLTFIPRYCIGIQIFFRNNLHVFFSLEPKAIWQDWFYPTSLLVSPESLISHTSSSFSFPSLLSPYLYTCLLIEAISYCPSTFPFFFCYEPKISPFFQLQIFCGVRGAFVTFHQQLSSNFSIKDTKKELKLDWKAYLFSVFLILLLHLFQSNVFPLLISDLLSLFSVFHFLFFSFFWTRFLNSSLYLNQRACSFFASKNDYFELNQKWSSKKFSFNLEKKDIQTN